MRSIYQENEILLIKATIRLWDTKTENVKTKKKRNVYKNDLSFIKNFVPPLMLLIESDTKLQLQI